MLIKYDLLNHAITDDREWILKVTSATEQIFNEYNIYI